MGAAWVRRDMIALVLFVFLMIFLARLAFRVGHFGDELLRNAMAFSESKDYSNALRTLEFVHRHGFCNQACLLTAGQQALHLGDYRSSVKFCSEAKAGPTGCDRGVLGCLLASHVGLNHTAEALYWAERFVHCDTVSDPDRAVVSLLRWVDRGQQTQLAELVAQFGMSAPGLREYCLGMENSGMEWARVLLECEVMNSAPPVGDMDPQLPIFGLPAPPTPDPIRVKEKEREGESEREMEMEMKIAQIYVLDSVPDAAPPSSLAPLTVEDGCPDTSSPLPYEETKATEVPASTALSATSSSPTAIVAADGADVAPLSQVADPSPLAQARADWAPEPATVELIPNPTTVTPVADAADATDAAYIANVASAANKAVTDADLAAIPAAPALDSGLAIRVSAQSPAAEQIQPPAQTQAQLQPANTTSSTLSPPSPTPSAADSDSRAVAATRAYFSLALAYLSRGDKTNGLKQLDKVIKKAPKHVDALFSRANLHLQLNNLGPAVADFRAVQQLDPGNATVAETLETVMLHYIHAHDFRAALDVYLVLPAWTFCERTAVFASEMLQETGRLTDALQLWDDLHHRNVTTDATSAPFYAQIYSALGAKTDAARYYGRAIELQALTHGQVADLCLKAGQFELAVTHLEAELSLAAGLPARRRVAGVLHRKLGGVYEAVWQERQRAPLDADPAAAAATDLLALTAEDLVRKAHGHYHEAMVAGALDRGMRQFFAQHPAPPDAEAPAVAADREARVSPKHSRWVVTGRVADRARERAPGKARAASYPQPWQAVALTLPSPPLAPSPSELLSANTTKQSTPLSAFLHALQTLRAAPSALSVPSAPSPLSAVPQDSVAATADVDAEFDASTDADVPETPFSALYRQEEERRRSLEEAEAGHGTQR